ncbi:hypothetical protein F4801DRAFT_135510 [Xylaria longipes]|nr:hypothetical protein F4801DRAFT_135510 [Xylaria longipes]
MCAVLCCSVLLCTTYRRGNTHCNQPSYHALLRLLLILPIDLMPFRPIQIIDLFKYLLHYSSQKYLDWLQFWYTHRTPTVHFCLPRRLVRSPGQNPGLYLGYTISDPLPYTTYFTWCCRYQLANHTYRVCDTVHVLGLHPTVVIPKPRRTLSRVSLQLLPARLWQRLIPR